MHKPHKTVKAAFRVLFSSLSPPGYSSFMNSTSLHISGCEPWEGFGVRGAACWYKMADTLTVNRGHISFFLSLGLCKRWSSKYGFKNYNMFSISGESGFCCAWVLEGNADQQAGGMLSCSKTLKQGWILAKAQIHVHWAIIEMGYLVKKYYYCIFVL